MGFNSAFKGLIESTIKILNSLFLLAHLHDAVPLL